MDESQIHELQKKANENINKLITESVYREIELNQFRNPYITLETIILRLYKKIELLTGVPPYYNEKTILFRNYHQNIMDVYIKIKSSFSQDEKTCVERVLNKDFPHTTELAKFASCFYKYNPINTCMWFAVDGILGNHPKLYVYEAFSEQFCKHKTAVRALYSHFNNPEIIKEIIEKAFCLNENEPSASNLDPKFDKHVTSYMNMVGEKEMKEISAERKLKVQQLQQPKRKKQ